MKKAIQLSVSLLLVLAILVTAVPAMAAGTTKCDKIYTIRLGDTRPLIAAATGMTWAQIAALNNLPVNYKVVPGTKLCVKPQPKATTALTAAVTGDKVQVSSKVAPDNLTYFVRARDASKTSGGWENLGFFKVYDTMSSRTSFNLPKDLRGILPLTVCFKDTQTDKFTCMKVLK